MSRLLRDLSSERDDALRRTAFACLLLGIVKRVLTFIPHQIDVKPCTTQAAQDENGDQLVTKRPSRQRLVSVVLWRRFLRASDVRDANCDEGGGGRRREGILVAVVSVDYPWRFL
jgi:hypothetical protein